MSYELRKFSNVTGTVGLTLNQNNTITLRLGSDFRTAAGPDIRAYLINSNGLNAAQIGSTRISSLQNLEFGIVGNGSISQNGAKTFTIQIPPSVKITDFDKIFFYCLGARQFWDFGSFTKYSSANCAVLGIEGTTIPQIELFPNPATSEFNISELNGQKITATIYDVSGKRVAGFKEIKEASSFDISSLASGLYIIELKDDNGRISKKKLTIK